MIEQNGEKTQTVSNEASVVAVPGLSSYATQA